MAFDTQITDLVGGTIDQVACDQWAADACRELIQQLPMNLKIKCSTISVINATNGTTLDLDGIGNILHVTRLSADSNGYHLPCREIPGKYADLANDSTDLNYYATVTDPVYWLASNSSDVSTLFVLPTPTDAQQATAHHITYPTVNVSDVSTIANFPDEAEQLVVLYVATRQLLQYQSTMSSSFNTDIGTAFTATNTELDETQGVCDNMHTEIGLAKAEVADALTEIAEAIGLVDNASNIQVAVDAMNTAADRFRADGGDPASFGDESEYTTGIGMTKVKDALDNAQNLIDNNAPASGYDVYDQLQNEDIEMVQATLSTAQAEIQRAQVHIQEWQTVHGTLVSEINAFASEASARYGWINAKAVVWQGELSAAQGYMATAGGYANEIQTKIAIANGYIAEANARLGADNAKYQWYGDQYAKLSAEYARGLVVLKGG